MSGVEIYKDKDNQAQIEVRFEGDTVWLTQKQMAELFKTTPQNITIHLKKIYKEAEVPESATCKEYLQVQLEDKRRMDDCSLMTLEPLHDFENSYSIVRFII